ncbi:MAG TPA: hypothetical protein VIX87_05285 [Steroidobacteraceae bacterium]
MKWEQVQSDWQRYKAQVKQRWPKLSMNDLDASEGVREVVAGKIIEAYAVAVEEADRQIAEWVQSLEGSQAPRTPPGRAGAGNSNQ